MKSPYKEVKRKEVMRKEVKRRGSTAAIPLLLFLAACTPRVEVAPPDEPITINLNVKIEHEVRVKIEKQLEEEIFSENSDLF